MKNLVLNLPTFGFVVATRAMLGVGIGLLLSERLPAERLRTVGMALVLIGAATTIPGNDGSLAWQERGAKGIRRVMRGLSFRSVLCDPVGAHRTRSSV